jgi:hypothetical protein
LQNSTSPSVFNTAIPGQLFDRSIPITFVI